MNERMHAGATSSLNYCPKPSLLQTTSSLSYLTSHLVAGLPPEIPLHPVIIAVGSCSHPLSATSLRSWNLCNPSLLFVHALHCPFHPTANPHKARRHTVLTMCPSCSCYNAFSNLRLQARKAGASQHQCFPGRSHANVFRNTRLQSCVADASHQIDQYGQRAQCGLFSASRGPQFLKIFSGNQVSLQSQARFSDLVFEEWFAAVSYEHFQLEIKLLLQSGSLPVDSFP